MKLHLDIDQNPWSTWYAELYKESRKNLDINLVTFPDDADFTIGEHEIPAGGRCTGVPKSLWYDGNISKTGGFSVTVDGAKYSDELGKMMRTYFAMCLNDDPDNDGQLICMEDMNIFSATELPFETFNNVYFNGLQPNPKMHKMIKSSKVFMSPSDKFPWTAIDALFLGTPIIVKDTGDDSQLAKFLLPRNSFYKDEQELAQKIKYFSDIKVTDSEYIRLVESGFDFANLCHTPEKSLDTIRQHILRREYDTIRLEKD